MSTAFCGFGIYFMVYVLNGYIFSVKGEKFSRTFNEFDPRQTLKIGPFTGLAGKGLSIRFRYKAPWESPPQSFRLAPPPPPAMSYHLKLFGCHGERTVLINERKFKHDEESDESSFPSSWREETYTISDDFPEYYLEIALSIDLTRSAWVKHKKQGDAEAALVKPLTWLMLEIGLNLRPQDVRAWKSNPNFSLSSSHVEILD